jgi:long-chain acyl-CoA synthetase
MAETQPRTLTELFTAAVERFRERECMRSRRGGQWQSLSFGDVGRRVRELTLGLHALGVKRGDKIAIWSENRPEWTIGDLASLALGAVDVPIYTTQAPDQVEYVLTNSGARAIFVSGAFLQEAVEIRNRVPSVEFVICFDHSENSPGEALITAEELIDDGRALFGEQPDLYETLWKQARPDDLATLLYTSGTTGEPKGVMLSHKNLVANVLGSCRWLGLEGRDDIALTYLPFSHIFERAVIYVYLHVGTVVAFAESIDSVADNMREVRPTAMTSVPRMFEKIYARILQKGSEAGFPRKQIFFWALGVGRRWSQSLEREGKPGWWLNLTHRIADALVFKKWREAVGGRIRVFISGGAALAPEIAHLFRAAGLPILQGYGLTETSPSISCNTEQHNRIGSVGKVIDGVQVRIAEDGEILVKGDSVMQGYYNRPADNAEAFTPDGWLCTGDIGELDADGYLTITDRKKELIKTSGGKYIAPQRVESLIKSSRFVSQVVVIGNERKFASALIVPNLSMLHDYAKLKGIDFRDDQELVAHPRVLDLIERQVEKYTVDLARYEKVKKIALLENEMTIASGELTPTLKPRRTFIENKYRAVIDALYQEPAAAVMARVPGA